MRILFASVILILFPISILAKTYIHGYHEYPPFVWNDPAKPVNEQASGPGIRLAKKLYEHIGIDVEFKYFPYTRLAVEMQVGRVHLGNLGGSPTPDSPDFYITNELYPVTLALGIMKKASTLDKPIKPEEFEGKSVVVRNGWELGPYRVLEQNPKVGMYKMYEIFKMFEMLKHDRVKYVFMQLEPLKAFKVSYPWINEKFENKEWEFYILSQFQGWASAVSKHFDEADEIYQKLVNAYQELIAQNVISVETRILVGDTLYRAEDLR